MAVKKDEPIKEVLAENPNLYQRILQVYLKVTSVVKDDVIKAGQGEYKAVSHDAVTKSLHLPIAEAGLVSLPTMLDCVISSYEKEQYNKYDKVTEKKVFFRADVKVRLTLINAFKPEETLSTDCWGYAFDSSDKATTKAYSTALKACYLKLFMLESLDKEEERSLENEDQRPRQSFYQSSKSDVATRYFDGDTSDEHEQAAKFQENMTKPIPNSTTHNHLWKTSKIPGKQFCSAKLPNGEWCQETRQNDG